MKLLIVITFFLVATVPCFSDVTGSYIENTPTEIGYLQLAQTGNLLDGSIQVITKSASPTGYVINNANLSGTAHGASIYVRIDNGWLGKSSMFSGEVDGASLTIGFPQPDGHIGSTHFRTGSSSAWNELVTTFETRMRRQGALQVLVADYSGVVRSYDSYGSDIGTDMNTLQSTVSDFSLAHVAEAKAERMVDRVNVAVAQCKADMDRLQSDMNALQAAMNADQANANAHQSDPVAYQSAQNAYQSDMKSYQVDESTFQTDIGKDEVATSNLYAVENSSSSSLWRITDRIWDDIAKATRLHDAIVTNEGNLRILYGRATADRQEIGEVESMLKMPSTFAKQEFPSQSEFDQEMDELDAQLTEAMPKPPTPLASHGGTIIVDSAAVRDYNPDDGSLHHDVSVLGTLENGHHVEIKGQTFNDYVIQSSVGNLGVISKSDVQLDAAGSAGQ